MKILSIHKYYFDRDGASRYQLEVNRLLEANGYEVIPFAMEHPENLKTPWSKYFVSSVETSHVTHGFDGLRTFGRMLYSFEARDKMRRLIAEAKPDVAHVHNIYTQISPSILDALTEAHIPAVMTVHDYHLVSPNYMLWKDGSHVDMRRWGLVRSTLSRFHKHSYAASFAQMLSFKFHRALRFYDRGISKFLCPSEFVAREMIAAGYPENKVQVLPHGIDVSKIEPSYEGDGSVLFVGRFVEEKGVRFVLDLAKEMSNTKFILAGDGPLWEEIRARARQLLNVEMVGWLPRGALAWAYRRASAVIVPSLWQEVFGLVALEGMAYGKAVIVSDRGGLPEVVQDGVSGLVLPAGDLQLWKDIIGSVLANPKKIQTLGKAARKRVETLYAPQKHLAVIEQAFHGVRSGYGLF